MMSQRKKNVGLEGNKDTGRLITHFKHEKKVLYTCILLRAVKRKKLNRYLPASFIHNKTVTRPTFKALGFPFLCTRTLPQEETENKVMFHQYIYWHKFIGHFKCIYVAYLLFHFISNNWLSDQPS